MRRVHLVQALVALASAAALSGCAGLIVTGAAAGAGAGAVLYAKGDLEATVEQSRAAVVDATRKAVEGEGLTIDRERETEDEWIFDCRRGDGKEVTIKVKELTPSMSRIYIRVGTFGDEAYSRQLLDAIKKQMV